MMDDNLIYSKIFFSYRFCLSRLELEIFAFVQKSSPGKYNGSKCVLGMTFEKGGLSVIFTVFISK